MRILAAVFVIFALQSASAHPLLQFSINKVGSVRCDTQTECPDGNTCCRLGSGGWGCCPLPSAVCCSDDIHCCPNGYKCDVSAGTCTRGAEKISLFEKQPPLKSVPCPGGTSVCPDGNTCCKLTTGQWGCCPLPNAVCCSDHEHCCPQGYTCDVAAGTCTRGAEKISLFQKQPPLNNVICPDGQSECPDGNTCCKLSSGQWGCCPLPRAVCCSDGEHCCPQGYTCDVAAGTCTRGAEKISLFQKQPSLKSVPCPGSTSICPDGNTCCKLTTGQWGCCPLPNAVCCSDHEHCCPQGYTCDVAAGTCTRGAEKISLFQKQPSLKSVPCPGSTSICPDGNTCCKLTTGQWGCCPLPNAVCCSDHEHCCPQGYTCDVAAGTCTRGAEKISLFQKQPPLNNVICPDGQSECPDGNTCCKLSSGQWGCCPLPNAVCCSDHEHCCPQGYTCDVAAGTCTRGAEKISLFQKQPPLNNVICPDGQSECPDGNTCCKLSSGQWGCCPLPRAVCCSDGEHCCPQGYTCDVAAGTCTRGAEKISLFQKQPSLKSVPCPGSTSICPDGNTCCKLTTGQWGCCPLPNAVCCSDHEHCCPQGYTCDVAAGTCTRGAEKISLFQKQPPLNNIICPDGRSECPDGNTCCKLSSGQWGCCPLPKAVCCSDDKHCCPQGYTCEVSQGKCIRSKTLHPVMQQLNRIDSRVL